MSARDYTDIISGGLLLIGGAAVGLYAAANYTLGTLTHMGPGMFPAALGFVLAALGGLVFVPALFRAGRLPAPDYRQFVAVMFGVLAFALLVDWLGLVPAIFLLTVAAVLADNKLGIFETVILAAVLSLIAVLVFRLGLGIPIPTANWPF